MGKRSEYGLIQYYKHLNSPAHTDQKAMDREARWLRGGGSNWLLWIVAALLLAPFFLFG